MFTLFFAGKHFAPHLKIADANIQDFLQGHYIAAMARVGANMCLCTPILHTPVLLSLCILPVTPRQVQSDLNTCLFSAAETLATEDNVIGFDTLDKPNLGMIGLHDLTTGSVFLTPGPPRTWFESFQRGEGFENLGTRLVNSKHMRAWKEGSACIWRQQGVWDVVDGQAVLLKKDYFQWRSEEGVSVPVDLSRDYFMPFAIRFKIAINKAIERRGGNPMLIFLDRNIDLEIHTWCANTAVSFCCCEPVEMEWEAVRGFRPSLANLA